MRGQGRIFKRGKKWWIGYYVRGQEFRETAGYKETDAKRLLKSRLGEIHGKRFVGPKEERIAVDELLDNLILHLENKGAKSILQVKSHLKPIREAFGFDRAIDISTSLLDRFISEKKKEGKAPATINREIGSLKQAFNLAKKQGRVTQVPYFPMLLEDNARQGFFEKAEFEEMVSHLPEYLTDFVRFAYYAGWRKGEMVSLAWENVDREAREIRIKTSKNRHGRVLPLEGELWNLIERRWKARNVTPESGHTFISPLVFHRNGKPIGDYRKAWKTACEKAGCKGRLVHDFRRTAARNMTRAGVSQNVAMSITGHRTISMFLRYNIASEDDKREALLATQKHIESLPENKKVVAFSSKGLHKD